MCSKTRNPFGKPAPSARRRAAAFSLIEIMVVVVIIGLLAGAVALKVGDYVDTAKINRARGDLATIKKAIDSYHMTHSRYPSNDEQLTKLNLESSTDPWGKPYEYNLTPGQEHPYEVYTLGADGVSGGEGINADIFSWDLAEKESDE